MIARILFPGEEGGEEKVAVACTLNLHTVGTSELFFGITNFITNTKALMSYSVCVDKEVLTPKYKPSTLYSWSNIVEGFVVSKSGVLKTHLLASKIIYFHNQQKCQQKTKPLEQ